MLSFEADRWHATTAPFPYLNECFPRSQGRDVLFGHTDTTDVTCGQVVVF